MKSLLGFVATLAIAGASPAMAQVQAPSPAQPAPALMKDVFPAQGLDAASSIVPVAEGCGPGRWRGPWGGCRGPGPGYYAPPPPRVFYGGNGCPPGSWRGPWGHCRDTPYHGRLPDGGWR